MKDLRMFSWLLQVNQKQKGRIVLLAVSSVLVALLSVCVAVVTRYVVDYAASGDSRFWIASAWLGVVGVAQIALHFLSRHLHVDIVAGIDVHMKKMLFSRILRKEYGAVSGYHSGTLLTRVSDDVRVIAEGMAEILPGILGMSVRLLAAFCVVCFIDVRFAVAFLLLGVVSMLCAMLLRRKMKTIHRREQEASEEASGFMQESMGNLLMVKTFGAESRIEERGSLLQNRRMSAIRLRKNYSALMNLFMNVAFYGGYLLGLIWCAANIATGHITVGMFSAVLQLTGQIERPLTAISHYAPRMATVLASAERICEILQLPEEPEKAAISPERYETLKEICAEDVSFAYDRDAVLEHVDFSLKKGEFAVISGISGIGKSTLMKLLLGVYPPESGKIYLRLDDGDVSIDSTTRGWFAYVPQGNFLLSGTLLDNICMLCPNAGEEKIQRALEISDALEFVEALPQKLNTVVGEHGIGLSEGQQQRIAIARALLTDAPVLLLDECTSALDEETEGRLLNNLRQLTDKTCLMITHRKVALGMCDSVYTMDRGILRKEK